MEAPERPKLAVFKFASCDGCQLALLSLEDELLELAGAVEIAYFLEASSALGPGPYDVALAEGSITTLEDLRRLLEVRTQSKYLISIGACATAGGIQALRNWKDVRELAGLVYPAPGAIETLKESLPISAYVPVDFELNGCPINKYQLLEVLTALLHGRAPGLAAHSVCVECKRRGTVCVTVAQGIPCLGPLTHAGCGAICPAYNRGCYGCFGPADSLNPDALLRQFQRQGAEAGQLVRLLRGFTGFAPSFRAASEQWEKGAP
jgi:sulfhydrogenase subunit delta